MIPRSLSSSITLTYNNVVMRPGIGQYSGHLAEWTNRRQEHIIKVMRVVILLTSDSERLSSAAPSLGQDLYPGSASIQPPEPPAIIHSLVTRSPMLGRLAGFLL